MSPLLQKGRAAILLSRVIAGGDITAAALAGKLNVSEDTLEAYRSGRQVIPLNHQARLALFVIANLPAFTREGNRLRGQIAAAIAYETHETVTHDGAPPTMPSRSVANDRHSQRRSPPPY